MKSTNTLITLNNQTVDRVFEAYSKLTIALIPTSPNTILFTYQLVEGGAWHNYSTPYTSSSVENLTEKIYKARFTGTGAVEIAYH